MKLDRRITWSLVAAALAVAFSAPPSFAGLYFESTNVTQQAGQKKGETVLVHSWVDGDNAKVLFVDGDRGMMQEDSYLLTTDGGETLYLVNPKDENYFKWDVDGLMAGLGAIMQDMGPMLKMEFSDPHYEKLGEEPGTTILGRSTRKVTSMTSFVMDMKVIGVKRHDRIESKQEAWITRELTDMGLGIWLRRKPPSTGDDDFDELLRQGWESIEGFPLKTITTTLTTNKKGKTSSSVSTMDVTVLREQSVDGSTFVIPSSYTEVDFMGTSAGAGQGGGEGNGEGGVFKRFGLGKKKKKNG